MSTPARYEAIVQQDEAPRRPGRPARPVTRDHLLRIARQAFAELGYAGASMGDIAARSGIRKSSLFHHFATKDDLYRESLAGVIDQIGARMMKAHDEPGSFLERMDRATVEIQRYFGENPVAARLLVREFVNGGANLLPNAGDVLDGVLKGAIDLLESAMRDGVIQKQDPKQLVMSIAGVHLLYFAMPEVSARLLGRDVFSRELIEERARIVCVHLRRLCGAPPLNGTHL
jgi:TetR/AcrR family transcriptional regulator